jgi:hypothetical protein
MIAKLSWLGVCVLPLAMACGDDGAPSRIPDARPQPDAPMKPCKAAPSYTPTFTAENQEATDYPAMGSGTEATLHNIFFEGELASGAQQDYLFIDLYEGYGAFEDSDIIAGTFPITGDDTAYSSCGACLMIAADVTSAGVDDWYVAINGILNLTSVSGRLTGSISNVTFHRVLTHPEGGPSDTSTFDCESRIASASFDAELVVDGGGTARSRRLRARVPAIAPARR